MTEPTDMEPTTEDVLQEVINLVLSFLSGDVNEIEFLQRYDNAYYREAFDGHESESTDARSAVIQAVRLLAVAQSVVDRIYSPVEPGSTSEQYREHGRIEISSLHQVMSVELAKVGLLLGAEALGRLR